MEKRTHKTKHLHRITYSPHICLPSSSYLFFCVAHLCNRQASESFFFSIPIGLFFIPMQGYVRMHMKVRVQYMQKGSGPVRFLCCCACACCTWTKQCILTTFLLLFFFLFVGIVFFFLTPSPISSAFHLCF